MPSNDKAQGPQKKQHGQGSKDSKLEKRNKNVSSALPDRQKEAKEVSEISAAMSEQETVFEPWQLRVIELQSQGWSFEKIIEAGEKARKEKKGKATWGRGAVILPSRKTLWKATTTRPEFKEICEKSYAFAVDAEAQRTLELSKSLDQIPDLKPSQLVEARYKRIQTTLTIAGRIHPDKWGQLATSEREVIVFEPYGGWLPTNTIKGAPGQGAEAESAAERWRKMRQEAKDA
jgi:hypothetical protein